MAFFATLEACSLELLVLGSFVLPWAAVLRRRRTVVRRLLSLRVVAYGDVAVFSQFLGERLDRAGFSAATEESVKVLELQPVKSCQSVAE